MVTVTVMGWTALEAINMPVINMPVTIYTMLNNDVDFDGHIDGDVKYKQTFRIHRWVLRLPLM